MTTGAVLIVAAACGGGGGEVVDVYAASSLTDAYGAVAEGFEAEHPDYEVRLNLAGSATLQRQILDGAEADVFAPADIALLGPFIEGVIDEPPPQPYARNTLTLVVADGADGADGVVDSLDDLAAPGVLVARCASGVPCGDAADAVLAAAGVVPDRATEEPNVRSVLTKVARGEVDAGLVYVTDAAGHDGVTEIPLTDAPEVLYAVLALTDEPGAAAFVDYVQSPAAARLLAERGFVIP
ncbi:MAG: molybdate ABC transporter substrate-binding protein [Actinomycetota bacterium]